MTSKADRKEAATSDEDGEMPNPTVVQHLSEKERVARGEGSAFEDAA